MVLDYALDDSRNGIDDYRMVLMKKVDMTIGGKLIMIIIILQTEYSN